MKNIHNKEQHQEPTPSAPIITSRGSTFNLQDDVEGLPAGRSSSRNKHHQGGGNNNRSQRNFFELYLLPRKFRLHRDTPWKTKFFIYTGIYTVLLVTLVAVIGELLWLPSDWCTTGISSASNYNVVEYANPDHNSDPCRMERSPYLFFMTIEECEYLRQLLLSIFLGGLIGFERRASDRPAGIRTMALVSLGSCSFTISSIAAFKSSTMNWDASRVTAAIPSGVGFLGAGLIWKGTTAKQVHGLTTAASLWLSAAIGCGCGGKEYFMSFYCTLIVVMVLRYGPMVKFETEHYADDSNDGNDDLQSCADDQSGVSDGATSDGGLSASAHNTNVNNNATVQKTERAKAKIQSNLSRIDLKEVDQQLIMTLINDPSRKNPVSTPRKKKMKRVSSVPTFLRE